jgi:hypothetical protein
MRLLPAALLSVLLAWPISAANWTVVQSEHFELYTSGAPDAGRKAVVFFEHVRDLFAGWNAKDTRPGQRIRIVVFQSDKEFRQYEPNPLVAAFYVTGRGGEFIVMKNFSPETYPVAVHEYVHLVVNHSGYRLPTAMNEGLAEFYSTLKVTPKGIEVGDAPASRIRTLQRGGFFPLPALLSIGPQSPAYRDPQQVDVFYAESWALTHMLLLSPEYSSKTSSYARAMQTGPDPLAILQRITGKTVPQIESDLQRYVHQSRFNAVLLDAGAGPRPESLETRPAAGSEVDGLLDGLLESLGRASQPRN